MTFSSASNPFVGLRPFESNESLLFFGRQEQTLELLQRLYLHHFVAVTGSSGSGKSSLIRAGLIPFLKAGFLVNDLDRWVISIMKPGESPLCNLADAILSQVNDQNQNLSSTDLQNKIIEEGVDAILDILKPLRGSGTNFFLLIDQFEELFRFSLNQTDPEKIDEAVDFVNIFLELSAQTELPIYVVITMRSDFIGDCAQFFGLPEALNQSQYVVPRLNRVQLRKTIEGPVSLFNGRINAGLTARLLNDAQLLKDELPLLEHALMRIWDRNKNSGNEGELDIEDYESIGGIEKALSNHADEALQGMSQPELILTKKIFQALTSIDEKGRKVRRPARLNELQALTGADGNTILSILNRFIEGNRCFLIISTIENKNDELIDISHESLIRQWSTLNTWVDEEAESAKIFLRLVEATTLYEQKDKNLLTGNELQRNLRWYQSFNPGEEWAQRYSPNFKSSILYLKQSEQEEKKQRYRRIRNRKLLIAATIAVIMLISAFAISIYRNNIKNKKELALNYWKSSQSARSENNLLDALHFIGEAANLSNDPELTENLLIDGEAYLPHTCLKNIFPQNGIINSVVFNADGVHILTAGNDGSARIIDKITGDQTGPGMNQKWPVNSAVFSPDGKWILTAGNDKTARIWEATSQKQIISFQHTGAVTDAVFSPDGTKILTASADSTARIWDVSTGNQIIFFRHEGVVTSAVFSPDARLILTSCDDMTVRIWDIKTKKQIGALHPEAVVTNAVFSPDAKWILTSGRDSTARIWDAVTMKPVASLQHGGGVTDAIFSPDGKLILTASRDKTARLWDVSTWKQIGPVMKHEGPVYSVAFSTDGKQVLTAGWDKTIRLWDIETATDVNKKNLFRQRGIVNSAVFNTDGTKILTAGNDSTARLWDVSTGKEMGSLQLENTVNYAVFNPDGTKMLTASDDSTARIWDVTTTKQMDSLKLDGKVYRVMFSFDGKRMLTASDRFIRVWDIASKPSVLIDSFSYPADITSAVFSADGKTILIASADSAAHILDAASGKEVISFKHENIVNDAVFSPGGNTILTACRDRMARVWDVVTGKQTGAVMEHDAEVNSAVFSPDGKWIVTAGWDSAAHLWNTATSKEIGIAKKNAGALTGAVFSPDGRSILASCYDSTVRLWEIEGDLDLPASLFELQAKATTGVAYIVENSETRCIPTQMWLSLKEKYNNGASEHYKVCKYPRYNLWRRFNKDEAGKIRPDEHPAE
ncbi:MAG: WD40 repeat domain-containing protein [Ginsengibacter sp.]